MELHPSTPALADLRPAADWAWPSQEDTDAALCKCWQDRHAIPAACQLAARHRGLALRLARRFRELGSPWDDLAAEAYQGLMRAICRFETDFGAGFAAYAAWWIVASLAEHVLANPAGADAAARQELATTLRYVRGRIGEAECLSPATASVLPWSVNPAAGRP
jgi:RNA polymerase sigma-32 factor